MRNVAGYALAKQFAKEGKHVIATTRKLEALEGLEGIGIYTCVDNNAINIKFVY
jgi:short-subunit dehydrogenase